MLVAGIAIATGAGAGAVASRTGAAAAGAVFWFLEFYGGVISLVALSLTVMGGLASTDRIVLLVRHRILLYAVHRAMAMTAMTFLIVHILTKIAEEHVDILDVAVPFLADHRTVYIGLGTIASYLMVIAAWTGIIRGRFAGNGHPWMWRVLHSAAYVSWPIAITHGLESGRSAKTWVTLSYILCLILVGIGLAVRLTAMWNRQLRVPKAQTTGTIRPVGRMPSSRRPTSRVSEPRSTPGAPRYAPEPAPPYAPVPVPVPAPAPAPHVAPEPAPPYVPEPAPAPRFAPAAAPDNVAGRTAPGTAQQRPRFSDQRRSTASRISDHIPTTEDYWGTPSYGDLPEDVAARFLGAAPMSPAPTSAGLRYAPGPPQPSPPPQTELIDLPQSMRALRDELSDEEYRLRLRGGAVR